MQNAIGLQGPLSQASFYFSILAIIISLLSLIYSIRKYQIDKSMLRLSSVIIQQPDSIFQYPSMESDKTEYNIEISIENQGYRDEMLSNITFKYGNTVVHSELSLTIKAKSKQSFIIARERGNILKMSQIKIFPIFDKPIIIRKRKISHARAHIANLANNRPGANDRH